MASTITQRVQQVLAWLNLSSWAGWTIVAITGLSGAALMAWLSSQLVWFWNTFGLFGVGLCWLIVCGMLIVMLRLSRGLFRTWRGALGLILLATGIIMAAAGYVLMARDFATPTAAKSASGSPQTIARARVFVRDGAALTDEPAMGVAHLEGFPDETVLIEFNQTVDPATIVVRKVGTPTSLEIVNKSAKRVRFKLRLEERFVTTVIVEAVVTATS